MKTKRLKVAVIFGGRSPEYGISLQSAYGVISNMDREKYEPVMLGITEEGRWFHFTGEPEALPEDRWKTPESCVPALISPDCLAGGVVELTEEGPRVVPVDVALPILHGKNGEDGTIQGLLELAGIPVAGCGVLSSALCMDKDRAHKLASLAGVEAPASFLLKSPARLEEALKWAERQGYPVFVKPVKAGSSYGITRVEGREGLAVAVKRAFGYDDEVLLEEAIPGFEVGCAVLGNEELILGAVDEIELAGGFFDYKEKYERSTAAIHVPARIPEAEAEEIKEAARRVYLALGCRGFARVDLFLTPEGRVVFNEVNTIPGLTACSRFPNMLKAAGISFTEAISIIIELGAGV
ncbi:MAG: D-alanine--D-serine ligase VanG [Bacillota bacterium]|nr:D-alanine--D-serine ligase VanG [Bacillota bacterium]